MFQRNARDAALLARVVKNSKCFQTQNQSSKSVKSDKVKLLRREDKLFFGKLLETTKKKLKRIKLESKGKEPKVWQSSVVDSEYAWTLRSSLKLSVFSVQKPLNVPQENLPLQANLNCYVQDVQKTADVKVKSTIKLHSTNEKGPYTKSKKRKTKKCLLSTVMVEKLLEFPILEPSENSIDNWSTSSKIMSLSPMKEKTCLKYPSVSKILSATKSEEAKSALERWKETMIEKLGVKGFELYYAELLADGKSLHSSIMNKLTEKPFEVPDRIKKSFLSLSEVFENINQVRAIESHVIHRKLLYRGIVDCIAVYRGDLCLMDWKKSDNPKETIGETYDAPLQLASYIGALNTDLKYPFQIKKGIIVVAYTNGNPAKLHEVNEDSLQLYWKMWLQRLQEYHTALHSR